MKIHALLVVIIVTLVSALTVPAHARLPKAKPRPAPEKSTAHASIVSVSNAAISIKAGHETKNYRIDGHTAVTLDGNKVGIGALKAGQYAEVTPGSIDPGTAMSIAATTPKGK